MAGKVAVVTGSNRGLGFGIVKLLCESGIEFVYLTSRNIERGREALKRLEERGLHPLYHHLDTSDYTSIKALAEHISNKHGGLDILINNAGVSGDYKDLSYENAKYVIDINYKNNLKIQQYFFPILNNNARVVNITSDFGLLSNLQNPGIIELLTKEDIELEDVNRFIEWFLDAAKANKLNAQDFRPKLLIPYTISHIALNVLTRIQQKYVGRGISVNSVHPGYIQTDMTWNNGDMTVNEASVTPVYLVLNVDQSEKGKFMWFDKTFKNWSDLNVVRNFDHVNNIIPEGSTP